MGYIALTRARDTLRRLCIGCGDINVSMLPTHPLLKPAGATAG